MFSQSDSDMLQVWDVRSLNRRRESGGLGGSFNHALSRDYRHGTSITVDINKAVSLCGRTFGGSCELLYQQEWLARRREQRRDRG